MAGGTIGRRGASVNGLGTGRGFAAPLSPGIAGGGSGGADGGGGGTEGGGNDGAAKLGAGGTGDFFGAAFTGRE